MLWESCQSTILLACILDDSMGKILVLVEGAIIENLDVSLHHINCGN